MGSKCSGESGNCRAQNQVEKRESGLAAQQGGALPLVLLLGCGCRGRGIGVVFGEVHQRGATNADLVTIQEGNIIDDLFVVDKDAVGTALVASDMGVEAGIEADLKMLPRHLSIEDLVGAGVVAANEDDRLFDRE